MFDFSEDGITLSAVLDTRSEKKEGVYPIKIRVTYKRVQKYYPTGKNLTVAEWENLSATKNRAQVEVRNSVQRTADRVKEIVKDLIKNDNFSFDTLNARLGKSAGSTLNTAFNAKMEELEGDSKLGTYDWYKYSLRSFILFEHPDMVFTKGNFIAESLSSNAKIPYSKVTVAWLKAYEKAMIEKGKSYTSISMYLRALQVIVNEAVEAGKIKKSRHPFGRGKYEIPEEEGRNIALAKTDIGRIVTFECKSESMEMCRDIWFFSYLCNGANITDICKLRYSNIQNGEIGFYRQKTLARAKKKKLIQAFVTPEMQNIINRWGNSGRSPDEYIFPFLKGGESPREERKQIKNITHLINDKMKLIGQALGIGNISTYTARHSFATVLKRSGANLAAISEGLGHYSMRTTEGYLSTFEQEERVKNAGLLTDFKMR